MTILLLVTVVQRSVGFGRGMLFCRWLTPESLGEWDMAYSFLLLAAPAAVLGLPGSFGRYLEHYRQRGQLAMFLRRTASWTTAATLIAMAILCAAAPSFSHLIFGRADATTMVYLLALSLAAIILHHFLESLFAALRMFRVVSTMHFMQSCCFAAISLTLLLYVRQDASSIVIGYGAACLISAAVSLCKVARQGTTATPASAPTPHVKFWPKLLRFAVWVWVANILCHLFAVVDRYMIIHHGNMDAAVALDQVGQYHSSRVIPLLLVSVADLLGTVVFPYLSHDWEGGRKDQVSRRLNLAVKLTAAGLLAAGTGVLLVSPLVFTWAFADKFHHGFAVLPWTITYCVWGGMHNLAIVYLWCAEKTKLSTLPLIVGLVANVSFNLLLLPVFGLIGAVWATVAANLVCLSLTFGISQMWGWRLDRGVWLLTLAPFALGGGTDCALAMLGVVILASLFTNVLLTRHERDTLRWMLQSQFSRWFPNFSKSSAAV